MPLINQNDSSTSFICLKYAYHVSKIAKIISMLLKKVHVIVSFFLLLLHFPNQVHAQKLDNNLRDLALSPGWLALGHYRKNILGNKYVSEADVKQFFLSDHGSKNPEKELMIWKDLLESGQTKIPDAVCRFPARYMWVAKAFDISLPWLLKDCSELQLWLNNIPGGQVSIIFASAYLESPSSMFGHTFIRFQKAGEETNLSTNTINYAADTSSRRGILDFAYRGLLGGFPGVSDQLPMYRRMRNYLDNEGRDLVEYYLRLTLDEVTRLKLHLFEIRGHEFEYFFLDENCSYRLLAAIETVNPELELLNNFEGWAIPIDTIKELERNNMISQVVDWHSGQKKLYFHASFLSEPEKKMAIAIAKGTEMPAGLTSLPNDRKTKLLYVAAEYNSLLINRDMIDRKSSKAISNNIMKARLNLNSSTIWSELPPLKHTGDGHPSSRYTIAIGKQGNKDIIDFNYRSAYHTFDDPIYGFNPGAEVVILNYGFRATDDSLTLQELEIIRVKSRTPDNSFFSSPSWDFTISYNEKYFKNDNHHVLSTEYLKGKSFLVANHIFSGMLGGSFDISGGFDKSHDIEMLGKLTIINQSEDYSYLLSYRKGRFISGTNNSNQSLSLKVGIPILKDLITIKLERKYGGSDYQTEATLGFSGYF